MAYLPVEYFKRLMKERAEDKGKFWGSLGGGLLGGLPGAVAGRYIGAKFAQKKFNEGWDNALTDRDLLDMWTYTSNQGELVQVLELLFDLANDVQIDGALGAHPRAVFTLGGDVHHGARHVITSNRDKHWRNPFIYQLISSPISNKPPKQEEVDKVIRDVPDEYFLDDTRSKTFLAKDWDTLVDRNFGRIAFARALKNRRVYQFSLAIEGSSRAMRKAIELDLDAEGPITPTDVVFSQVKGNPALIQSRFGTQGNFELVVPGAGGGLNHCWRDNDHPNLSWNGPFPFGEGLGQVDAVSLIQSNFGTPGNLEVIARVGDRLHFFGRDSGPPWWWHGPVEIASGVRGNPALIQSRFGTQGNFELVVPAAGGGLHFYWRNNDDPNLPWNGPFPFGEGLGEVDGLSLIQGPFGSPGNLEVVARAGDRLHFFGRDSGPPWEWHGPFEIASGVRGNPVLIQSRFGTRGNYELVVPAAEGGLNHYGRDNDDPNLPWYGPFPFGGELGEVDAVSLIQSNFGSPGNLEVIARAGDFLHFYWRDSTPPWEWHGRSPMATGASSTSSSAS
jgi:hypothetical protein